MACSLNNLGKSIKNPDIKIIISLKVDVKIKKDKMFDIDADTFWQGQYIVLAIIGIWVINRWDN